MKKAFLACLIAAFTFSNISLCATNNSTQTTEKYNKGATVLAMSLIPLSIMGACISIDNIKNLVFNSPRRFDHYDVITVACFAVLGYCIVNGGLTDLDHLKEMAKDFTSGSTPQESSTAKTEQSEQSQSQTPKVSNTDTYKKVAMIAGKTLIFAALVWGVYKLAKHEFSEYATCEKAHEKAIQALANAPLELDREVFKSITKEGLICSTLDFICGSLRVPGYRGGYVHKNAESVTKMCENALKYLDTETIAIIKKGTTNYLAPVFTLAYASCVDTASSMYRFAKTAFTNNSLSEESPGSTTST